MCTACYTLVQTVVTTEGQVFLVKAVSNAWTFLQHQEVLFA